MIVPENMPVEERLELYSELAIDGSHSPAVLRIAAQIADAQRLSEAGGQRRTLEDLALEAAQRVGYVEDPRGPDQIRGVENTIAQGGDCEDLVILLAAILRALGVHWQIVWIDRSETGYGQSHVTLRLHASDGAWKWAEPSIPSARVGDDPLESAWHANAARRIGQ